MCRNVGMLPRRSKSVCSLMAALVERNGAHGNNRQAQVDGAGIERVDRIFQIDAKRLPGIKTTGDSNERLGQVGIDAPVAHRVRIGQGVAGYAAADAHVIELARLCSQASFDVAQAFAIGKLRERHAEILIEARKRFDFVFAPVTRYAATKRRQWQMLHDLRENQLAHDHRCPLRMSSSQDGKCQRRSSNRDRNKAWIIYSVSISCGRTIDRRWDTTAPEYYNQAGTHLALQKDAPLHRTVQRPGVI